MTIITDVMREQIGTESGSLLLGAIRHRVRFWRFRRWCRRHPNLILRKEPIATVNCAYPGCDKLGEEIVFWPTHSQPICACGDHAKYPERCVEERDHKLLCYFIAFRNCRTWEIPQMTEVVFAHLVEAMEDRLAQSSKGGGLE